MGKCPICGKETIRGNEKCADCFMNNRTLKDVGQKSLDPPEEVKILFDPKFKAKMLDGTKNVTTRQEIKGMPDTIFRAFDATFMIIGIKQAPLTWIIQNMWKSEGFDSEEECRNYLTKRYNTYGKFWLHFFKRIDGGI